MSLENCDFMRLFSAQLTAARAGMRAPITPGKRLLFGVLFTGLLGLSPAPGPLDWGAAYAQERGQQGAEKVVKLRIFEAKAEKSAPQPAQDVSADRFAAQKTAELTQLSARRIRERLKAAEIKDFSVTSSNSGAILVRVRGHVAREVITGIVVPRGRLELRPVEPAGVYWVRASAALPAGIKVRQEPGSLDANHAYLWSADEQTLRDALQVLESSAGQNEVAPGAPLKFAVYPDDAGWRSLALSPPIATHQDVASASMRQGKTGEPFVQLLFQKDLGDALQANAALSAHANSWAVLLDGEVVSLLSSGAQNLGNSLNIKAPAPLRTRSARHAWAQQVAGRLAAYIPVPLIEDRVSTP